MHGWRGILNAGETPSTSPDQVCSRMKESVGQRTYQSIAKVKQVDSACAVTWKASGRC